MYVSTNVHKSHNASIFNNIHIFIYNTLFIYMYTYVYICILYNKNDLRRNTQKYKIYIFNIQVIFNYITHN